MFKLHEKFKTQTRIESDKFYILNSIKLHHSTSVLRTFFNNLVNTLRWKDLLEKRKRQHAHGNCMTLRILGALEWETTKSASSESLI